MPSFHGITAWFPSTLAPPQSCVVDLLPLMHATPSRRKGAAVTCRQRGSDCCSGRGASLLSPVQSTVPRLAPPPLSALLPWVASKRPSTGHFPGTLLADARHRSSPRRLSNLSRPRRQNTTPPVPAGETQQAGRQRGRDRRRHRQKSSKKRRGELGYLSAGSRGASPAPPRPPEPESRERPPARRAALYSFAPSASLAATASLAP